MWWVYALLSAFFAALTAVFVKAGVKNVNTDLATAIRTVVVLIIAWGIAYFRGGLAGFQTLTRYNYLFLVISGIATGLSWIFYFKAMETGTVAQVAPIDKLSVALAVIFAVVFLGEALTWKMALGAGLIVAGTIVLIL